MRMTLKDDMTTRAMLAFGKALVTVIPPSSGRILLQLEMELSSGRV